MFGIRRQFVGAIRQGYKIRTPTSDETFYTVPTSLNKILVRVDALRIRLSFPLDSFIKFYLNAFELTPIQLTPNSQAYLLGFTKYARQILRAEPSINLFRSIFTMAIKRVSYLIHAFSRVDMEVKAKFKGSLSKLRDWKANFIVVKKLIMMNAAKDEAFALWGFTTHEGEISINWGKKYWIRDAMKKKNSRRLLTDPFIYNI